MAVNDGDSDPRLGCGRLIDDVWATAQRPPDAHEQTCPFCQNARRNLQDLTEATDALVAFEAESPDYAPTRNIKDLVMQLVHLEVRRGQPLPLETPDDGMPPQLAVSEQAVLDLIWKAADTLPGIRARHCSVELHPVDQEPGRPAVVHVNVTIAVSVGTSIPESTRMLRARLGDMVATHTGLTVRRISVTVEDLYDA
jgi:hypothetical protein